MKNTIVKVAEGAVVVIALIIAVIVARSISVESFLRGKEEPVTLSMTEDGLPEDFIGRPAGEDIPLIESAEDWENAWPTSYVTIQPAAVISTGFGARHPWVGAYTSAGRRGGTRRRPDVSQMIFDILDEYGEYFILQLPDQSYILAQMSTDTARKAKAGKEITLPVGRKTAVHRQVLANIQDLCETYNVDTEGVFYCINDQWNQDHYLTVQLIRLGIGFVIVIVLGTIFITIVDKILKVKD